MSVPRGVDTDYQPPMELPLVHFVAAVGLLLVGVVVGLLDALSLLGGLPTLAHVHLLVVGWVCVTIMGAMTQFVPVWSGVRLHSRRLGVAQLVLVVVGVLGLAAGFVWTRFSFLPVAGAALAAGLWVFCYNVARTLPPVRSLDVTERHFLVAVGFFAVVPALGLLLAGDMAAPFLGALGVSHAAVLGAHATVAVFGAVGVTVVGALYQLAPMFTQTDLHGVDHHLRRVEEATYPLGVLVLATGRLVENAALARGGGLLVLAGLTAFGVVVGRRLVETRLDPTPMLRRYAVAVPALFLWVAATVPVWLGDPLSRSARFGAGGHLLLVGVVGFVVLGTLYHVVPFIVWVHRYSDRLGYERVPMIDDLYVARVAVVDFWLVLAGGVALVAGDVAGTAWLVPVGGALWGLGALLFAGNIGHVLVRHGGADLLPGFLADAADGD